MTATAPRGLLDAEARQLELRGAISVFTDEGYELHTDLAHFDLAKGIVTGSHKVNGQGPAGTFVADRFRIERLMNPCEHSKKSGTARKSKARVGVVCPPQTSNSAAARSKPTIYLIGNVHMKIYPGAMKKKK